MAEYARLPADDRELPAPVIVEGSPQQPLGGHRHGGMAAGGSSGDLYSSRDRFASYSGLDEPLRAATAAAGGGGSGTAHGGAHGDGDGRSALHVSAGGKGAAGHHAPVPWVTRRVRLAGYVLASIVLAVAAAVGIYYLARPKAGAAAANPLTPYQQACTVFCNGPLLSAVQAAGVFNDSKTFVDMPMVLDPPDMLEAFAAAFPDNGANATRDQLAAFVNQYFLTAGSDTVAWVPDDYEWQPPLLMTVGNATLRNFTLSLNDLWLHLGRQIIDAVRTTPQRFSLVWQPHPMIVPGGRFLESYYWDSYWVVLGLLRCGMTTTATGVSLNLLHMLDTFGFVPNGGRTYYALPGRSQPPLLTAMVKEIYTVTGNASFLAYAYPSLQAEYAWWMQQGPYGHAVTLQGPAATYTLNRYVTFQHTPRPESWLEDVHTAIGAGYSSSAFASGAAAGTCGDAGDAAATAPVASGGGGAARVRAESAEAAAKCTDPTANGPLGGYAPSSPAAQALYSEIAAAAETGWDFSARWFADGQNLTTCDTSFVVPADLNAILYGVESNLASLATTLNAAVGDVCAGRVWPALETALAAASGGDAAAAAVSALPALTLGELDFCSSLVDRQPACTKAVAPVAVAGGMRAAVAAGVSAAVTAAAVGAMRPVQQPFTVPQPGTTTTTASSTGSTGSASTASTSSGGFLAPGDRITAAAGYSFGSTALPPTPPSGSSATGGASLAPTTRVTGRDLLAAVQAVLTGSVPAAAVPAMISTANAGRRAAAGLGASAAASASTAASAAAAASRLTALASSLGSDVATRASALASLLQTERTCGALVTTQLASDAGVYATAAAARAAAIEALMWDEDSAQWHDLIMVAQPNGTALDASTARMQAVSSLASAHPGTLTEHKGVPVWSSVLKRFTSSSASTSTASAGSSNAEAPAGADVVDPTSSASAGALAAAPAGSTFVRSTLSSVSNFIPLWTGAYDVTNTTRIARIVDALTHKSGLYQVGGLASTMANTTQQWDFPNGWAPLQHMVIVGLNATGVPAAVATAHEIARVWTLSNFIAFQTSGYMHEKYDVTGIGSTGSGGEYTPQVGFGWTNGVALDLITRYNFTTLDF